MEKRSEEVKKPFEKETETLMPFDYREDKNRFDAPPVYAPYLPLNEPELDPDDRVAQFLSAYRDLVDEFDLIIEPTKIPFQLVVRTIEAVQDSNAGGNDWHNYHHPIAPESKQGILDEIIDMPFKED